MEKLAAKALIRIMPLGMLAEVINDKAEQQDRVNKYMRKWGKKPTILDAEEARSIW